MEQPQPTHRPWGLNKIEAIAAGQPSGAKALLSAVLELGLPYTMERDDILHGFIYGSEALVDQNGAQRSFKPNQPAPNLGRHTATARLKGRARHFGSLGNGGNPCHKEDATADPWG